VGAAGAATGAATPGVCPKLPTADTWVGGRGALADVPTPVRSTALVSTVGEALDKGASMLAQVALVSAPIVTTGTDTTSLNGAGETEVVDTPTLEDGTAGATVTSLDI